MNKIIVLLLVLLPVLKTLGQEQDTDVQENEETPVCTQNLRLARSLYEEGKLNEIPPTLKSCLNKIESDGEFTPEEKVEAYRLLAITYLYLDEPAKADEAMLELLHTNPEYEVNERLDPAEYINLYRSFRTEWLFRWGIKGGGNYSLPHVTESFNPSNAGKFSGQAGFQVGALIEFDNLIPKIVLQPEILFTSKSFSYSSIPTDYELKSPDDEPKSGSVNATYSGILSYIELFVTGKYQIWDEKKYFALISPGVGYLLSAEFPAIELANEESAKIDLTENYPDYLNFINPQLFIGAGTEVKFGRFYAMADLRYGYSFMSLINDRSVLSDIMFTQGVPGMPDKLHSITFSISFLRATYNPKKIVN